MTVVRRERAAARWTSSASCRGAFVKILGPGGALHKTPTVRDSLDPVWPKGAERDVRDSRPAARARARVLGPRPPLGGATSSAASAVPLSCAFRPKARRGVRARERDARAGRLAARDDLGRRREAKGPAGGAPAAVGRRRAGGRGGDAAASPAAARRAPSRRGSSAGAAGGRREPAAVRRAATRCRCGCAFCATNNWSRRHRGRAAEPQARQTGEERRAEARPPPRRRRHGGVVPAR